MPEIADSSFTKHHVEITFLRALLFDMKKQLLGLEVNEPITKERIDKGKLYLTNLEECKIQWQK